MSERAAEAIYIYARRDKLIHRLICDCFINCETRHCLNVFKFLKSLSSFCRNNIIAVSDPKPESVQRYLLPFYVLRKVAITSKGKFNAFDVLQQVG